MHAGYDLSNKVVVDMLRHGEPQGGVMYRGSKDDPLSETGWQQMRDAIKSAIDKGVHWDRIISSPMKRCQAFAEETAQQLNLPLQVIAPLKELNFGDLEGLHPQKAWEQYPELLANMWKDPVNHTPPNGESFVDFALRVQKAMESLFKEHMQEHLLLVIHGGVVRAALHNLLGISPSATFRFDIPYASLTRFKVYKNGEDSYDAALSFVNGLR